MAQTTPSAAAQSVRAAPSQAILTPTDNVTARITLLHDQLQITPDEEQQWQAVAGVMRDNAHAILDAMQARVALGTAMNAVDDLQSYSAVAQAHADGLKKLTAVFGPLFAAMTPAQQRHANAVFSTTPAAKPAPGRHS